MMFGRRAPETQAAELRRDIGGDADTGIAPLDAVMTAAAGRPVILFDGVCVLCSGLVRFVIRHDPQGLYAFAAVQSPAGRALLRAYGMPLTDWETNVLVRDGRIFVKSRAFLEIMAGLGGPWALLRLGRALPRRPPDRLYDVIARNRYRWFGQRDACMVPDPGIRQRFL